MIEFDEYGFLKPYSAISADFETFERVFVEEFDNSTTRRHLFERYREYNARLLALMPAGFTQWVDGSFISSKINPNDIDVLTFVDTLLYEQHERTFRKLCNEFANGVGRVDAYTIRVYPENHRYRNWYDSDYIEWLFIWSRTNTRPHLKKGFIELVTN